MSPSMNAKQNPIGTTAHWLEPEWAVPVAAHS
jgi:hypothetical protein